MNNTAPKPKRPFYPIKILLFIKNILKEKSHKKFLIINF
jgi:hypothetical protein